VKPAIAALNKYQKQNRDADREGDAQYEVAKPFLRHHGTSLVTTRGNSTLASPPQ
jgi:hypothetical protein